VKLFTGDWASLAFEKDVVRGALKTSILVGSILAAINYGDIMLNGDIGSVELVKIVMTYAVPYCVSTFAAVTTHRRIDNSDKTQNV